ncbi:MAG: Uma2 family endonuclease [Anaerolineae bacterium]|nr:Uma2 family endonuclease [Anaerolineae bacterium]NUQ07092.1 Uma2 family endonuclease [Anaerolineae bacterium]
MSTAPKRRWTVEEYFAAERDSDTRYEFLDHEFYAMAGANPEHDAILLDLFLELGPQLRKGGCKPFSNDIRVKAAASAYFYPDLSLVCGDPLFIIEAGLSHLLNPTLIIEVLSPSTEAFDRGEKFVRYQQIDSLREYVLISQRRPLIEVFSRRPDNKWLYTAVHGLDGSAVLESVGATLTLAEVYRRVIFESDVVTGEG